MKPIHKIAMVCTTFVLAAATGHVMQQSTPEGMVADPAPPATAQPVRRAAVPLPEIAPVVPPLAVPAMRRPVDGATLGPLPQDVGRCAVPQLRADPAPGALVRLTVTAPCHAAERAEIRHEGLRLPIQLSDTGRWSGLVPAFAEEAVFQLGLDGGAPPSRVTLRLPEVAEVNRIAVTLPADSATQLQGYEDGAAPGSIGDVSASAPRAAGTRLGGWITSYRLPGAAQAVQIYSAPAAMSDIRLALETPVTPQNCGKDLVGVVLRQLGKVTDRAQLTLAMPACGEAEGAVVMPLPDFPLSLAAH